MHKLIFTAVMIIATICAKAQSIKVFNQCREKSRVFTFCKADAYSNPLKNYTIGSWCPSQQFPTYKLEVGNYEFNNLPVQEGEEWTWFITKAGKTIRKGIVTDRKFWTMVSYDEQLTIVIAEKFDCNCQASSK